jgi:hypothetical protein
VREQVPHGDRAHGRPRGVAAIQRIESLDDARAGELGQVLLDGIIEAELLLLEQQHHRERGDRLGHRGNAEDGIGPHRDLSGHVLGAECAGVARAAVVHDHRNEAGDAGLAQA